MIRIIYINLLAYYYKILGFKYKEVRPIENYEQNRQKHKTSDES